MGGLARGPGPRAVIGAARGATGLALASAVGIGAGCLLAGCSGRPGAAGGPAAPPAAVGLACAEPTWDLGEVLVKGDKVDFEHVFRLENRSKAPVTLREIRSDCSCLVAKGYARTLEPGGATEVGVKLSVFGPPGRISKTLEVAEDSGSGRAITLSVVGSRAISDLMYASPAAINFGTMTRGGSRTRPLALSRYDGSPVNFRGLVAEGHAFALDGEPAVSAVDDPTGRGRARDRVELPVRLDLGSEPAGPFRSRFTVRTLGATGGTAELVVEAEALIVEEATPWVRSVFIDRLERGGAVERPMTDREGAPDGPAIASASYEGDDSIRVEVVRPAPGVGPPAPPKVKVSRPADSSAGGVARGTLSLRTRGPAGEAVTKIVITAFLPG